MNIRKLQMRTLIAHATGLCNTDPFTAGAMGQRAPMMQDSAPMPPQQQATYAPNTVVPAPTNQQSQDPNLGTSFSQGAGSQPTADVDGGSSPIDSVWNKLYTDPNKAQGNGDGQPTPQPAANQPTPEQKALDLMNLPAETLSGVAGKMDFTKGISDTTMAKFNINPETGQPNDLLGGIMEVVQMVGQNAFTNTVVGGGKIYGTAMDQQSQAWQSKLPEMVNTHNINDALRGKNYHAALQPTIDAATQQLLSRNPNVSPSEVTELVDQLVGALGTHLAPSQPTDDSNEFDGGSFW